MEEVCAEFPSYVVLLDFSKEFPISDTFLCALNDQVHLSDNHGLPRLQRMISDVLAQRKFFAEEQQARLERGFPAAPFLPEHIWQKIQRHAIFSAVPACRKQESDVESYQPRVFNCDARHCSDSCPRHCKGGHVTLVSGDLESDPNYCQVDIGDDKFVCISAKWSRQRKLVQDKKKSSTVIGRNMNTFKKKKVVITPKEKVLTVKFPCVVRGCSHGYFKDDGKFLDHMIRDHSIIKEEPKAAPLSTQGPSQSDPSPLELLPHFSSECIAIASSIESPSFVVRKFLPWQGMEITLFIASVYLIVVQIQGGAILLLFQQLVMIVTESYLVTLTRFFVMCLSIILYCVCLFASPRWGHRVKSWST